VLDLVTSPSTPQRHGALFGKTREAVLGLLVLRGEERFHLRQVSRLTGSGLGPVQRELAELVAMGVIRREQSGRQVYFQVRGDCPVLGELRQLLLKTSGAAGVLRSALGKFQADILAAALFGSAASGKMRLQSDVDVLVVSEKLSMRQLGSVVREVGGQLGRDVNVNLYRPHEWRQRVRTGHPLARSIMNNPRIMLIGDQDELGRLAEKRVAETSSTRKSRHQGAVCGHRTRPSRQRR
jgi:predicted nucleotidyltransferase